VIKRRELLIMLGSGALAVPLASFAQQPPAKVHRIAFLAGGSRSADALLLEAFWQGMKERGYTEGKNIAAEYRFADGALERLPQFAAELVRLKVSVIVGPSSGVIAARKATDTIPIVMTYGDPLAQGLIASLARPGGNVTGLSGMASELGVKKLELLKEAFPWISRVAVLWGSTSSFDNAPLLENMKGASGALRVTLQPLKLHNVEDFEPAFLAVKKDRADAIVVLRNPLTATHRPRIVEFAARSRLPGMYGDGEFVEAGGLISYGVNIADLWGRAASYVDRILKGSKPADLPVQQPTKFELVINMKTAKSLGFTIPQTVLVRATKVIE
jgi:putative ABC transport system substrate-binding protein